MVKLKLTKISPVTGIYTVKGVPNSMPASMCFLAPDAATSWYFLHDGVIVSDVLRTPESSLRAVKSGRGAKMPGFSGHNFGFSIDVDVKNTMKKLDLKTKPELDIWMANFGWYCHRTDGKLDHESWHWNFLGLDFKVGKVKSTAGYLEDKIQAWYGKQLHLDAIGQQQALKKLGFYGGDIDGLFGQRSKDALAAFQRAWQVKPPNVVRTLAFVAREVELVPPAEV